MVYPFSTRIKNSFSENYETGRVREKTRLFQGFSKSYVAYLAGCDVCSPLESFQEMVSGLLYLF